MRRVDRERLEASDRERWQRYAPRPDALAELLSVGLTATDADLSAHALRATHATVHDALREGASCAFCLHERSQTGR